MPEDKGEVIPLFALLAELEQGGLPCSWIEELDDEPVHLVIL